VSRMRCGAQRCTADPGPPRTVAVPGLQRTIRFTHAALRPGHVGMAALFLLAVLRHAPGGNAGGEDRRKNRLVPQGGFEPSTYRLRSDCSAVELLRRPERALYQTSIKEVAPY
jgi:hypothetical protein